MTSPLTTPPSPANLKLPEMPASLKAALKLELSANHAFRPADPKKIISALEERYGGNRSEAMRAMGLVNEAAHKDRWDEPAGAGASAGGAREMACRRGGLTSAEAEYDGSKRAVGNTEHFVARAASLLAAAEAAAHEAALGELAKSTAAKLNALALEDSRRAVVLATTESAVACARRLLNRSAAACHKDGWWSMPLVFDHQTNGVLVVASIREFFLTTLSIALFIVLGYALVLWWVASRCKRAKQVRVPELERYRNSTRGSGCGTVVAWADQEGSAKSRSQPSTSMRRAINHGIQQASQAPPSKSSLESPSKRTKAVSTPADGPEASPLASSALLKAKDSRTLVRSRSRTGAKGASTADGARAAKKRGPGADVASPGARKRHAS